MVLCASATCSIVSTTGEEAFKAPGEEVKLTEELAWLNAESYNTTAFKFKDQTNKSPGSISVITAQDIKDTGARNLLEALDTIPGISAYKGAYNQRIQVRGVLRTSSQDVLMMVNGLPVTNNYIGSGIWVYNSMSLDFVKRIEVIKGPASSLYGANAFSAIINVITKDRADLDGVEFNQKFASEDTIQSSILFGKAFENGLELSGYADFLETDGFSDTIVQDRQSSLDSVFGTDASLAPGDTDNHENKIHLGFSAKFHGLFLDTMWTDRERGPNVGIYDALSDTSLLRQEDGFINLGYNWEITRHLTLTPNVYYHHNRMDNRLQLLPPGTTIPTNVANPNPADLTNLPLGIESRYDVTNVRQGTELRADWDALDNYKMVLGVNYEKMRQKDMKHYGNHYFTDTGDIVPLPAEQEITGDLAHIQREDRTFKAFYIENLWDVTNDLRLTFGGRYDHYSDFGGTFNPRTSLIWSFAKNYDFKFMYGRAFRAPSFYELYSKLPYAMGNPDLEPETIDSLEASLIARFTKDLTMTFTTFYNEIQDSIQEVPRPTMIQYGNTDEVVCNGFETEARYNLGRGSYLTANYTYQHSYDKETNTRVGRMPMHFAHFASNFRLNRQLNWHTSVNWQSAPSLRKEDEEAGYSDFGESYAVVNTGLTIKDISKSLQNIEIRAFVYNLFDKDYFTDYSAEIPYGVPAPGRQFMFELKVKF